MIAPSSIALIVATRNRPFELKRLLKSVAQQNCQHLRVILVDQSDAAACRANEATVEEYARRLAITHIPTETRGLSVARNIGLSLVGEDCVGFPDDDCWYPEELIAKVLDRLSDSTIDFLCGTYRDPTFEDRSPHRMQRRLTTRSALRYCNSVSLFVKTEVLRRSGLRFDERLGAGARIPAGEETDLVLRALRIGGRGFWDSSIVVYHAEARAGNLLDDQIVSRDLAFGYVLARNVMRGQLTLGIPVMRFLARWSCLSLTSGLARRRIVAFARGARCGASER